MLSRVDELCRVMVHQSADCSATSATLLEFFEKFKKLIVLTEPFFSSLLIFHVCYGMLREGLGFLFLFLSIATGW